jgi:hypothetical protein
MDTIFNGQTFKENKDFFSDCLIDKLSRNVGNKTPTKAAQHPRGAKSTTAARRKPKTPHIMISFVTQTIHSVHSSSARSINI